MYLVWREMRAHGERKLYADSTECRWNRGEWQSPAESEKSSCKRLDECLGMEFSRRRSVGCLSNLVGADFDRIGLSWGLQGSFIAKWSKTWVPAFPWWPSSEDHTSTAGGTSFFVTCGVPKKKTNKTWTPEQGCLTNCMTSEKSLHLSRPYFSHL